MISTDSTDSTDVFAKIKKRKELYLWLKQLIEKRQ
ncbi:hypothetical protein NT01CX_0842 [Clostridium novyi NT]|uniref:Uncharacterized protein n=1 Tax=Clostridium novyi (strain NT) TaxID=386415 RepID=A0Q3T0_CLONN|nr:hypothetical protein NT01CX_0842 [Clostridium novyi NT]